MIGFAQRARIPWIGLAIALVILGYGYLAPSITTHDPLVQRVLSIFAATVVLWITKPIPYAISSVLCVILLYAFGTVDSFGEAVSGFASEIIFFFILLYIIGTSVAKVDLDAWVARRLISRSSTPRRSGRRLSGAIMLLALVMPSGIARTVTFMPVVDQITEYYGLAEDSPFRRFAYYVLGHLNPVASLAVMTGSGMAVTTAVLINDFVQPFTWLEWAVYLIPPIVTLYVICIIIVTRLYAIADSDQDTIDPDDIDFADDGIEPLDRDQRIVVALLGLAVCLWVVGSFVGVPAIIPAMLVVFVLAVPGVDIVTTEEVLSVSWGIVFLIGAMLSLLAVMQEVNAMDRIIDTLIVIVPMTGPVVITAIMLFVMGMVVRGTFSSSTAAIVIMLPILLEFGGAVGINPLYTAFTLMMLYNATAFLPFNAPTVLISHETGPLTLVEIFGLCLVTLLVVASIATVSWVIYWPFVDALFAGIFG